MPVVFVEYLQLLEKKKKTNEEGVVSKGTIHRIRRDLSFSFGTYVTSRLIPARPFLRKLYHMYNAAWPFRLPIMVVSTLFK